MKILCWGDSNTYGYDPRGFLGGRYDPDSRWCDLLEENLGCTVINGGENGRTTPLHRWEYVQALNAVEQAQPLGLMVLMLGTNDLLVGCQEQLSDIADRMELLIDMVQQQFPQVRLLLLAPPPVRLATGEPAGEIAELARLYRQLAEKKQIFFAAAHLWEPELAYDGVHLSPEGHRRFASRLAQFLREQNLV